jgi:hypothetical protein
MQNELVYLDSSAELLHERHTHVRVYYAHRGRITGYGLFELKTSSKYIQG